MSKESLGARLAAMLKNNGMDFYIEHSFMPEEILANAIDDFILNGKDEIIPKYHAWAKLCSKIFCYKEFPQTPKGFFSLEEILEGIKLKQFFNDASDLGLLYRCLPVVSEYEEIQKKYKELRKEGFSPLIRNVCLERDGYLCVLCGSDFMIEIDHVIELADGGDNSLENAQTLCRPCHRDKTAKSRKERMKHIL